jgi:hypothetical protein
MSEASQMACRVCGWWPPLVRVVHDQTQRASERWRWRQLAEHVFEQADVEEQDGRMDGPHQHLEEAYFAVREQR